MSDGPHATPPFPHVAIAGLGLIGGSVALAARRAWPAVRLTGIDRAGPLEAAARLGVLDVATERHDVAAGADLVLLAAPVQQNISLLRTLAPLAGAGTLFTDVGSTKRAIAAAARELPAVRFVGGHPLAGAARGGLELARGDLFRDRPWLLTPVTAEPRDLERLKALVAGLGARPGIITADAHDALLAYLSHLPQLASTALMDVIGRAAGADGLGHAGPGLHDVTRLAASPADIWIDICATNADALREALGAYIDTLAELRDHLGDPAVLRRVFDSANRWRRELDT